MALSSDGNTALVGGDSDNAGRRRRVGVHAVGRAAGASRARSSPRAGRAPTPARRSGQAWRCRRTATPRSSAATSTARPAPAPHGCSCARGQRGAQQGAKLTGAGATAWRGVRVPAWRCRPAAPPRWSAARPMARATPGPHGPSAAARGHLEPAGIDAGRHRREPPAGQFGSSVALSADGVTALVGGDNDTSGKGAAWAFVLNGGSYMQQAKLTPSDAGRHQHGVRVKRGVVGRRQHGARSADPATEPALSLVREPRGSSPSPCRSGASRAPSSPAATPRTGSALGSGVALSSDGNVALIGGKGDGGGDGAAWLFARSGSTWAQQGTKLTGQGENLVGTFGQSVALAADGQTALIGGNNDSSGAGAAWAFAPAGSHVRQRVGGDARGRRGRDGLAAVQRSGRRHAQLRDRVGPGPWEPRCAREQRSGRLQLAVRVCGSRRVHLSGQRPMGRIQHGDGGDLGAVLRRPGVFQRPRPRAQGGDGGDASRCRAGGRRACR